MEIFLVYFPSNRCLWGYGLPGRAWQLVNKDNRAGTQAVWKLLFFGACSLKFFIWTSASLRDIVMLFTTATKSYRKHYSLSFLPTSYSPLQNFATTDVCHNTYCWLSLCFPKKRIMSFKGTSWKAGQWFLTVWSNNLCNFIAVFVSERDLKLGARDCLQVVCNCQSPAWNQVEKAELQK